MPSHRMLGLSAVLTLSVSLVGAAPTRLVSRNTPITAGSSVSGQTYDYIIAGGGLAGSVLAARLGEDASKTILLIEAGYDQSNNPQVYDASQYQAAFGSDIDWAYQTVNQGSADGQPQTLRSGKMLSGSTGLNGLAWSKPETFQLDALETVGNAGVNWNSLQTYMLRAENYSPPSADAAAAGLTYDPSCHATGGPIGIQYDPSVFPAQIEQQVNQTTVNTLGFPYATDLTCGQPAVVAPIANTRVGNTRADAYRGYLYNKNIAGLTILQGANVGRVLLSSDSTPRATGVEFRDQSGTTYTANANLEVIVATGSIKTPSILQQSGIGPTGVLSAAGVTQRVELPIGQNLIDQTTCTTNWRFQGTRGGGQDIFFPRFEDLVSGSEADNMRSMLQNDIVSYAQDAVDNGAFTNATALEAILNIQVDWILNQGAGVSESFDYTYSDVFGYDSWYLLPFGRGSIQIKDNNAYGGDVAIDPRYFSNAFDRLAQGATSRFTRTVSTTNPLGGSLTAETTPGTGDVPSGADLEAWAAWSQIHFRSNWHPIGTAAMMSQELGGSVNANHSVYGTTGLRVVDGSNLPFQVSSHLMSVLYGLSERAADIIKEAHPAGTTPPSGSGIQIHPEKDRSKCLQASSSNLASGVSVTISDCNGSAQQQWTLTRGPTKITLDNGAFAIDGTSGTPASGTKMKIWQSYAGLAAQKWYWTNDNYLAIEGSGQCLDLTDGSTANGNVIQVWECSSNNANQRWYTSSS